MNVIEGLRIGLLEIRSHKLRSFLTLFGIAVGITSVMSMTGIMSGFQVGMRDSIKKAGLGRLFIWPQQTNKNLNRSSGLIYEDSLALARNFPELRVVSPVVNTELNLFDGSYTAMVHVGGITPAWRKMDWNYSLRGRFLTEEDVRTCAKVCVLVRKRHDSTEFWRQDDPLDPLFKRRDPLRRFIRLGPTTLRVVGILDEGPRDDMMDMEWGEKNVLLPITTYQKRLTYESRVLSQIDLDTGDSATSYGMAKRVFGVLKRRHRGVEDFQVKNIADMMGAALKWANNLTIVMGLVAAIALFAGGVGIMNITLASVHARIKEIGIRKSVGARERDIRRQFLLEAVALSLMGGVLGVALGCGICWTIKTLAHMAMMPPIIAVFCALAVSIGVGVAFSWYPARQASQLDPVEALRYE